MVTGEALILPPRIDQLRHRTTKLWRMWRRSLGSRTRLSYQQVPGLRQAVIQQGVIPQGAMLVQATVIGPRLTLRVLLRVLQLVLTRQPQHQHLHRHQHQHQHHQHVCSLVSFGLLHSHQTPP